MRYEVKTLTQLENQFLVVLLSATGGNKSIYVSGSRFKAVSKALLNTNIIESIKKRFGSNGKGNGFNELKKKHGYAIREAKSKEQIIDHYFQIFNKLGEIQPREKDIIGSGISMTSVYNHFGTHIKAIKAMYKAKAINLRVKVPVNVKPRQGEYIGDDLRMYNIGLAEGPVNEQGVVFLFAKIHHIIGFPEIEKPKQEFPDCRATCLRGNHSGKRVNIEFKFLSKDAFKKKRPIEKYIEKDICYLICWEKKEGKVTKSLEDNGIEVIELKAELKRLYKESKIAKDVRVN